MKKILLSLAAALLLVGAVSAQQTNTNWTTCGTIYADGDKFMDVNRWQDTSFGSAMLFADLQYSNITMGYATKTMFPVYVGMFYTGKTWQENASSSISVIVGKDNMAGKITFSTGSETLGGKSVDNLSLRLNFGMNGLSNNIDVHAGLSYKNASTSSENTIAGTTTKTEISHNTIGVSGGARIPLEVKGTAKVALLADASFYSDDTATTRSVGSTTTTTSSGTRTISVEPALTVDYALTQTFAYGLKVSAPFVFSDTIFTDAKGAENVSHSHTIKPVIDNGISGDLIAGKLKLNGGYRINLPSIDIDDTDDTHTALINEYYVGFDLKLGNNVDIDTGASLVKHESDFVTESLDDLWKTRMYFTVSIKF